MLPGSPFYTGHGPVLCQAISAAGLLDKDFGVSADIWSCPSFENGVRDTSDAGLSIL